MTTFSMISLCAMIAFIVLDEYMGAHNGIIFNCAAIAGLCFLVAIIFGI